MFPSEQPDQNDNINIKNNNNNNNNTRSKSLDIKRKIVNSLKRIIRKSFKKCCWPPSNHLVSAAKPTLPISSYLLALISCSSILLLLFIVHSAQSTRQPSPAMSWPSPQFNQQPESRQMNTETSRVKRSPPSSEASKSPRNPDSLGKPRIAEEQPPSFRDGQSANNRGSLPSSSWSSRLQTSGQWIPIVKPQLHNSSLTGQAPSQPTPLRLPPPERLTGGSNQVVDNQQPRSNRHNNHHHHQSNRHSLQPLESHDHHHHIRHMHVMARQHPQHQRRRPRFNYEPPVAPGTGGLYRRVLLCDKTLVSLEYIRNLNSEHRWRRRRRPMMASGGHLHMPGPVISGEFELSDFTDDIDNSIDLEGNYDSSPMARQDQTPPSQPNITATPAAAATTTTTTITTSNSTDDTSNSIDRMAHMSSFNTYHNHHQHHHRHRPPTHMLLGDDDPLVRCDMWDLEKGLKNRAPPDFLVRQAVKADFETVREAINRCRQLSERTHVPSGAVGGGLDNDDSYKDHTLEIMSTEDLLSLFSMKRGLMPGTKWCGLGDQAATYNDLGPKYRIDICCRAHDHCPIRSKPFRNDYGVLNIGLYTKSHCDCDADFYRCLREVRSRTADLLGNLYFNVMKLQCMREERMKVCREMKPIALLGIERCTKYEDSPIKTIFKFTTPPVAY